MAYQDIATVNISLQTAGVTQRGFGIPLFASAHRYFNERVRTYTSLTAAGDDLPTTSNAYKAVQGFLSNTTRTASVKIGRRTADMTITVASGTTAAAFTFSASNGTNTYSISVDVTGQADEDATATAIASAIEADSNIGPLVTATSTSNVVTVAAVGTNTFTIGKLPGSLTEAFTTTETATDLITAINDEDDDYYFFTADDHTETFVLAASASIEAQTKMYFFSSQEQAALTAFTSGSSTDVLARIKDTARNRTKGMFHHLADTTFPETNYVGFNAPYSAGSVLWTNLRITGVTPSQDPARSANLSETQRGNLEARDAAYVERRGGRNILRGGNVPSGEAIDTIRGRDDLQVSMDTDYENLLTSQTGSKIPYDDTGINQLEAVCRGTLSRFVARGFIAANFTTNFPKNVSTNDKANRIYTLGEFSAELTGGITVVQVQGRLVLDLNA